MNETNYEIETVVPDENLRVEKKIGNMTYLVGVHFSKQSTDTLADRIKAMIMTECMNAKCV